MHRHIQQTALPVYINLRQTADRLQGALRRQAVEPAFFVGNEHFARGQPVYSPGGANLLGNRLYDDTRFRLGAAAEEPGRYHNEAVTQCCGHANISLVASYFLT